MKNIESLLRLSLTIMILLYGIQANAGMINPPGVIVAKHSGKCLAVTDASTINGATTVQYNCTGANHQQWTIRPYADAYQLIARHSGQCLNVSDSLLTDGAKVVQRPCTGLNNELWYAQGSGDYFRLVAKHSGKCLNVNGYGQKNGDRLSQWACLNSNNQLWSITALTHTPILAKHSNQCLDVDRSLIADGTGVMQFNCHGGDNQQWTLMPYQNAYRIVANHSEKCLSVPGASQTEGAAVAQTTCVGTDNELWFPVIIGNYYQLVAKHSNKCLTVNNASQTSGTPLIQLLCTVKNNQLWKINVSSTTGGKWSGPITLPIVSVAAAGLPNGKVLLWSGADRDNFHGGSTYTSIFDPATNLATERLVFENNHDMFCPGTSNLPDGRVLVNGGANSYITSIYNFATDNWTRDQDMNIPRGYQANSVLANGDVFTVGGSWNGGLDHTVGGKDGEVWNKVNGWHVTPGILSDSILTNDPRGEYRSDNHAWLFSGANGQVFHAGPSKQMNWFNTNNLGTATAAGNRSTDDHSMNGNASLYDVGKILKVGGAPAYENSIATKKSYIIDINNGVISQPVAAMAYARAFNSSVVLPDGSVMVFGGQAYPVPFTDAQPALAAELWDPVTQSFTTLASMKIPRTYHSVALLLPDARVFVGGGGLCGGSCTTNHFDAEIFTPPYLLAGNGTDAVRPIINQAPATAGYGNNITVTTNSAISKFALVRMSSVTHTVNNDQRRIPLTFTANTTANSYTVTLPANAGIATPGYYLLFALNAAGVPSISKIIKVG
jgi:galactose oxidase